IGAQMRLSRVTVNGVKERAAIVTNASFPSPRPLRPLAPRSGERVGRRQVEPGERRQPKQKPSPASLATLARHPLPAARGRGKKKKSLRPTPSSRAAFAHY